MQQINPQLTARIEEMVSAELGIPKEIKQELPDANLELVDMEASKMAKQDKGKPIQKQVSSGGSGCSSTNLNTPNSNSPRRPSSANRKVTENDSQSNSPKCRTKENNSTISKEPRV